MRCLLAIVSEAKSHTKEVGSVSACDDVIALINRSLDGDEPSRDEWEASARAASAAARAASASARTEAASAWTASAAAWTAAGAARAASSARAASAAAWAAAGAASDRIITVVLDAMTMECEAAS
jgi:hypothetical protein